jgi:predicted DNA-binding transcriptional regulator AlpA
MNTTSPAPAHRPDQRTDHADGRASRNGRVMPGQRDELLTVPQVLEILATVSPRTFDHLRGTASGSNGVQADCGGSLIRRGDIHSVLSGRAQTVNSADHQATPGGEGYVSTPPWHIPVPKAPWTDDKLICIRDIRNIFGLGRTAAYELTHRPEFPEPVRISSRCYRWWASEVNAFAASLRRLCAEAALPARAQRTAKSPLPYSATPRHISGRIRTARAPKAVL